MTGRGIKNSSIYTVLKTHISTLHIQKKIMETFTTWYLIKVRRGLAPSTFDIHCSSLITWNNDTKLRKLHQLFIMSIQTSNHCFILIKLGDVYAEYLKMICLCQERCKFHKSAHIITPHSSLRMFQNTGSRGGWRITNTLTSYSYMSCHEKQRFFDNSSDLPGISSILTWLKSQTTSGRK